MLRTDAPAEPDSYTARNRPDHRPKDNFCGSALRRVRKAPNRAEFFSLQSTVDGQANPTRPDRVHGNVEELHPHGVKNLESKQGP